MDTSLVFIFLEVLAIATLKDNPINEQIRCKEMMVIGPNGEQLGVKSKQDALTLAGYAGFDLVLMSDSGNMPVCKIMDYNKFKYEKKKKTKEKTTKNTKETTKTTTASKNESTVQTAENQTTEAKQEQSCEFLISCKTVLSNKSALQSNYQVPAGGKIYEKKMEFEEGDTVMDVLKRTGVDIDISKGYVAGIDGLYEFDCGKNSGWMYRVNGKFPNYMAGKCKLHDGDKVEWLYTCVRGDL